VRDRSGGKVTAQSTVKSSYARIVAACVRRNCRPWTGCAAVRAVSAAASAPVPLENGWVFLIAGMANPSPDPITMLILGGGCAVLVEGAELIVWANDRRRARLHPDPYAGLADDELSPADPEGAEIGDNMFS
jgi:hypothetical protein